MNRCLSKWQIPSLSKLIAVDMLIAFPNVLPNKVLWRNFGLGGEGEESSVECIPLWPLYLTSQLRQSLALLVIQIPSEWFDNLTHFLILLPRYDIQLISLLTTRFISQNSSSLLYFLWWLTYAANVKKDNPDESRMLAETEKEVRGALNVALSYVRDPARRHA